MSLFYVSKNIWLVFLLSTAVGIFWYLARTIDIYQYAAGQLISSPFE